MKNKGWETDNVTITHESPNEDGKTKMVHFRTTSYGKPISGGVDVMNDGSPIAEFKPKPFKDTDPPHKILVANGFKKVSEGTYDLNIPGERGFDRVFVDPKTGKWSRKNDIQTVARGGSAASLAKHFRR